MATYTGFPALLGYDSLVDKLAKNNAVLCLPSSVSKYTVSLEYTRMHGHIHHNMHTLVLYLSCTVPSLINMLHDNCGDTVPWLPSSHDLFRKIK